MNHRIGRVACAAAIACVSFLAGTSDAEPTKDELLAELRRQIAGREQEPAEAVFKDIRLFKGRPAEQLLAVMEMGFSRSLGVECSHCHDVKDWPGDARKEKAIACEMILMARGQKKPAISLDPPPAG